MDHPVWNQSEMIFESATIFERVFMGRAGRYLPFIKILLCIYLLGCVGFFIFRTAHWKQVNDPVQIHYLCFLMDHGMAPYRDLLEFNMPGAYLVTWTVMHTLGPGSAAWRIFDLTLMATACWAMIAIARPYDWLAGVFAAALFILYHGRDGAGEQGQRDLIIAVLLLGAYAFLFYSFRSRRWWAMFGFGICAAIAVTIKPTPLPLISVLLLLAWLRLKQSGQPILKPLLYAALGLLLPCAIVGAFLIYEQSIGSFIYVLRVVLPFYGNLGRLPLRVLLARSSTESLQTLAIIALAIALIKRDWWNWEGKLLVLGIVFGVASYFGQGKGFPYHRYPMLAFVFLWAGMQIIPALKAGRAVRILAIIGTILGVTVAPIYAKQAIHRVWDKEYSDSLTADLNHLGSHQLSGHVQCLDVRADCDATLYRMRLVQSTGLIYDLLIFGSSDQRVIRDSRVRFWRQLQTNPPQVIIAGSGLYPDGSSYRKLSSWPLFNQELTTHYSLYKQRTFASVGRGVMGYRIYVSRSRAPASERRLN